MIVAVFAALALSAVAAGSASAQWLINGVALGAGKSAALASLVNVHGGIALLTTVPGEPPTNITISCAGPIHLTNGRIFEPDLAFVQSIVFLNCGTVAPTPSKCKLVNNGTETISTVPVLALAALGPKPLEGRLTFRPETKRLFTEIPFKESTTCVFEGNQPVSGAVTVGTPTGRDSNIEQIIQPLDSLENNELEIGAGNKAFLGGGSALLLLASGSKWSFD